MEEITEAIKAPRPTKSAPAPELAKPMHPICTLEGCRWPFGDPRAPEFYFCNALPLQPGTYYCAPHARVAYAPGYGRRS